MINHSTTPVTPVSMNNQVHRYERTGKEFYSCETTHLGSTHLGSTHIGSTHLGSTQLGSTHLGSTHLGSTHLGSTHFGSTHLASTSLSRSPFSSKQQSSKRTKASTQARQVLGYLASATWFEFTARNDLSYNCSWILSVPSFQRLNFTLVDFSLPPSSNNHPLYNSTAAFSGKLPLSQNNYKNSVYNNNNNNNNNNKNKNNKKDLSNCELYATLREAKWSNGSNGEKAGRMVAKEHKEIRHGTEPRNKMATRVLSEHHVCRRRSRESFVYTSSSNLVVVTLDNNNKNFFLLKYQGGCCCCLIFVYIYLLPLRLALATEFSWRWMVGRCLVLKGGIMNAC